MNASLTPLGRYLVEVYDPQVLAEYVFRPLWHVPLFGLVALLAWWLARGISTDEVEAHLGFLERHERGLVALLAAASGLFSAWVATAILGAVPHIQDERAYLFEARLMAGGRLTAPVPAAPLDRACAIDFTVQDSGRWYGRFPPGWPALLAAGVICGAPHLLNPLLGFFGIVGLHLFLRLHLTRRQALLGTALAASSPLVTLMDASLLAHPAGLVMTLGGLAGYGAALQGRRWAHVVWGAAAGMLFLTRPHEGAFLWLVPALHLSWVARRCLPRWGSLGLGCLAFGLFVMASLAFNRATTGDAFALPTLRCSPIDRPGFSPHVGVYAAEGHDLGRGLHNTIHQWKATNDVLFGWPYLSLLPVALGLLGCRWRDDRVVGMLALAVAYLAFLVTWHNPGMGFGTRYHYFIVPQLVLLAVRGVSWLVQRGGPRARVAVLLALVYLQVVSVATHYPRRLETLRFYWRVFPATTVLGPDALARTSVLVPQLWVDGVQEAFASFEGLSTPYLGGQGIVAARDLPGVETAIVRAFPDRRLVRIDPDRLRRAIESWTGEPADLEAREAAPAVSVR
ncbi:MAG: hypothetical protein HY815_04825 [Candidatus Riflebacteria bacterium]|nr:hypothetical protein [Candidatus Riflebacteria bacterium]